MLNLARAAAADRAAYVNETAARRNVPAWMVEKDFWVCCIRASGPSAIACLVQLSSAGISEAIPTSF